jgi:hypothetical protein
MNAHSSPKFGIGQKVICINDSFHGAVFDWCASLPIAGYVYTIRAMQIGRDRVTGFSNLGFLLAEIVVKPRDKSSMEKSSLASL